MATKLQFRQLNRGWNAEPNAPDPVVEASGNDLLLRFHLNAFQYQEFDEDDDGMLRFVDCTKFRLGATNDEGWYRGQCRYSKIAPDWGEFYELIGPDRVADEPRDWVALNRAFNLSRHFLFYFRDDTFECYAADWAFEATPSNMLFRYFGIRHSLS